MIPHKQKFLHDPDNGIFGDCWRTCIASVIDAKKVEDVPHFYEGCTKDNYREVRAATLMRLWLEHNYNITLIDVPIITSDGFEFELGRILAAGKEYTNAHYLLSGRSGKYENVDHTVVCKEDLIVHDPSDSGIKGPTMMEIEGHDTPGYWITFFGAIL